MKKISALLVLTMVLMIPFITNVKADKNEKINVYLFRGEGCPHCAEAEEFFDELKDDEEYGNYYTLVDYEVWYDEDNSKFMEEVAKKLNTEASGVPFIVIGDKYFSGYASSMSEDIKSAIKTAYESEDYKDVVVSVKENKNNTKEEKSNILPIVIVSVVALAVVIAMIFFTKEK